MMVSKKFSKLITALILVTAVIITLVYITAAFTGTNVTNQVDFQNISLSRNGVIIPTNATDVDFSQGARFTFSIDWVMTNPNTQLQDGDYFEFFIPSKFARAIPNGMYKRGSDNNIWAKVNFSTTYNPDGSRTATVVFNENVVGMSNLSGTINIDITYSDHINGPIVWEFVLAGVAHRYEGNSTYVPPSNNPLSNTLISQTQDQVRKTGSYSQTHNAYGWTLRVNERGDDWNGRVTISDSFGLGHTLRPWVSNVSVANQIFYFGFDNVPGDNNLYFQIYIYDYNAMRQDYNELAQAYIDTNGVDDRLITFVESMNYLPYREGGQIALIPEGRVTTFMRNSMANIIEAGQPKYRFAYTGPITVNRTTTGFEIILEDLGDKSARISYYTVYTSLLPMQQITNNVNVRVENPVFEFSHTPVVVYIRNVATVRGITGYLILMKSNPLETIFLEGVEFTLRNNSTGEEIISDLTNNHGTTLLDLSNFTGPLEGFYTLIENLSTVPTGYIGADPITLELNDIGVIISVNGVPIPNAGLLIPGVGRFSGDGLIFNVYNELYLEETQDTITIPNPIDPDPILPVSNPRTGDINVIALLLIFISSLVGIIFIIRKMRKKPKA